MQYFCLISNVSGYGNHEKSYFQLKLSFNGRKPPYGRFCGLCILQSVHSNFHHARAIPLFLPQWPVH